MLLAWFRLNFFLGCSLLVTLVPLPVELLLTDKFIVFYPNIRPIKRRISLNLYFLVYFSYIPFESLLIELFNVMWYQGPKNERDFMFFSLRVREKLKRTVKDSSVVESGNNNQITFSARINVILTGFTTHKIA